MITPARAAKQIRYRRREATGVVPAFPGVRSPALHRPFPGRPRGRAGPPGPRPLSARPYLVRPALFPSREKKLRNERERGRRGFQTAREALTRRPAWTCGRVVAAGRTDGDAAREPEPQGLRLQTHLHSTFQFQQAAPPAADRRLPFAWSTCRSLRCGVGWSLCMHKERGLWNACSRVDSTRLARPKNSNQQ